MKADLLASDVFSAVSASQVSTAAKHIERLCFYRYTVLFAVARTVGWVSQWKEMAEEKLSKISRPRQVGQLVLKAGLDFAGCGVCSVDASFAASPAHCACQAHPALLARWPVTVLYCTGALAG